MSLAAIDLVNVAAGTGGFVIHGQDAGDFSGLSVASAGDLNDDGYADLIIGARVADAAGNVKPFAGDSYVVFGKASGWGASIDLGDVAAGTGGFVIHGQDADDRSGYSVASAGDINGDGFADLVIGAYYGDAASNDKDRAGDSYVMFGKASGWGAAIDLVEVAAGTGGFVIHGQDATDRAGWSIASAGDIDGDGYDDLIFGAMFGDAADNAKLDAGDSYVVFGKASGWGVPIDLTDVAAGTGGFVIHGQDANDRSGRSVASAGDLNGDGYADLIVGAPFGDSVGNGKNLAGDSYVIFGKASGWGEAIDLAAVADGTGGFVIHGEDADDVSGISVASAGDINGDGYADLIIGARAANAAGNTKIRAGDTYLVFGKAGGWGTPIDLADVAAGTGGLVIYGQDTDDRSGWSVASAGDLNGDGIDDLTIGAPYGDAEGDGKDAAGDTYVVFGKTSGWGAVIDLATIAAGMGGFVVHGEDPGDRSGIPVASAGDIDGDGFDDLIIGAYHADAAGNAKSYAGDSYVIFGRDFTSSVTHAGDGTANSLTGTAGADVMVGGQGADTLAGNGGADALTGGEGNDLLVVSDLSFLRVDGGTGIDTLRVAGALALDLTTILDPKIQAIEAIHLATAGASLRLTALELRNLSDTSNTLTVTGAAGNWIELLDSGWTDGGISAGQRTLTKGSATLLFDTALRLAFVGTTGADSILGTAGAESLVGGGGDDTIDGGDGRDMIVGGAGADSLVGGAGNDTLDYGAETAALVIDLSAGTGAGDSFSGFEAIKGGSGDDQLTGSTGNDTLAGTGGADTLVGGNGNDQLDGGADADSLVGGANDDLYIVNHTGDAVLELAGGGADRVLASVSWTMADEVERLGLTGGADLAGTGNGLANRIDGNGGANALDGAGGNDTLSGAGGADSLVGGSGLDQLIGGAGADTLSGGAGADRLLGGADGDAFLFASAAEGGDRIGDYLAAEDVILVSASGFGGGLVAGALDPSRFVSNLTGFATAATGQFIWETDAFRLWWDADGNGAGARQLVATLTGATLTSTEITVIA